MRFTRRVVTASLLAMALSAPAFAADKPTILVSVPGLTFPFFVHMMEAFKAETQLMYASDWPHWDFDAPSSITTLAARPTVLSFDAVTATSGTPNSRSEGSSCTTSAVSPL